MNQRIDHSPYKSSSDRSGKRTTAAGVLVEYLDGLCLSNLRARLHSIKHFSREIQTVGFNLTGSC